MSGVDESSTAYFVGQMVGLLLIIVGSSALIWSGRRKKRESRGAKGEGWIAAGVIVGLLLPISILSLFVEEKREDDAKKEAVMRPKPPDPGPGMTYENCEIAMEEGRGFLLSALDNAAEGDIDGMETESIKLGRSFIANKDCFPADVVAEASELDQGLDDELPEGLVPPPDCRQVIVDVYALLNYAAGIKASAGEEAASRPAEGFEKLSAANEECFPRDGVDTMLKKLEEAPGPTQDS